MSTRTFEVDDDLMELLDGGECVEKLNWRHGHKDVMVFEKDDKHWMTTINVHHEEGWDIGDTIEAEEVTVQQVTVTKWVPVS